MGASLHQELWVPAEQLSEFNRHLTSFIQVEAAWYGPAYVGPRPVTRGLRTRAPREQLRELDALRQRDLAAFHQCVSEEWRLVLCNHAFWSRLRPGTPELSASHVEATLAALALAWSASPRAGLRLPEAR